MSDQHRGHVAMLFLSQNTTQHTITKQLPGKP